MNPSILITGIVLFLACFSLHVLWWRCQHPKNDIFLLILIFFIIPFLFFFVFYTLLCFKILPDYLYLSFSDLLSVIILHGALSSAYLAGYPALQAQCPSLNIMLIVNDAMPNGIRKEEVRRLLGGDILLDVSIEKMIREGLAKEVDGKIAPTGLGKLVASFFIAFRSLLGIERGMG